MGASTIEQQQHAEAPVIIKTAKKALKRQESGSMKIKSLAKTVMEHDKVTLNCKETVKKIIGESDLFEVDGKMVVLVNKKSSSGSGSGSENGADGSSSSKKRKSVETDEGTTDGEDIADKKAAKKAKKAAKKAKKEKESKKSSSASSSDPDAIAAWRKSNKIVLKDSRSGEEGAEATKALSGNSSYFPLTTFEECEGIVNSKLIEQCVKVNGFQKPSPIQAQCWVSGFVRFAMNLFFPSNDNWIDVSNCCFFIKQTTNHALLVTKRTPYSQFSSPKPLKTATET